MLFKRIMRSIRNRFGKKRGFLLGLVGLLCGLLVADNLSAQSICFTGRRDYRVGTTPNSVAVGDFNGDSKADLAVANQDSNSVSILLGNGDGTFSAAPTLVAALSSSPQAVAVADFNGDGKADLVVVLDGLDALRSDAIIFLGNGDGTFRAQPKFFISLFPRAVVVGDFNRDGRQDFAVTGLASNAVAIRLGNGDGRHRLISPAKRAKLG